MIKGLIFDLDGVLVDTKDLHFLALNEALKKIKIKNIISYNDHVNIYDGLPTSEKLKLLNERKIIKKSQFKDIIKHKQKLTIHLLRKKIKYNKKIYDLFYKLSKNYKLAIATNAVRETMELCLKLLKIKKFCSYSICNNDLNNPKPHPEIYLRCLIKLGLKPSETIIIEDSHYGRISAQDSGCHLMPIKNLDDVTFNNINKNIKLRSNNLSNIHMNKWDDKDMNILIPMAGAGKRFVDAGYVFPKPIIEIQNKPMIQWVIDSLNINANYIFIIQKEHQQKFNLKSVLKILKPNCKIIDLDEVTEGAACTTLLAKNYIDNDKPLMIANSDQFIKWNSSKSLYNYYSKKYDGAILTFEAIHPKWSYAKCDDNNIVSEVAEKNVISKNATVGVYYWKKGSDYVKYAEQMIDKDIRVNNEFYVCPVYNEAIQDGKKVIIDKVEEMHGLGTPDDLKNFIHYLENK
jgi:HAD superfamily hydrolase (TIGR01509 family)